MCFKEALSIIIIIAILFSPSLYADNYDEIIWCHPTFPPAILYDEQGMGYGWVNMMIDEIISLSPNYKHRVVDAKLARFFNDARNKRNVCHAFLFKTDEREEFLYYSKPNFIVLPNGLVVKKERLDDFKKYINADGAIKLSAILEDPNYKLGLSAHMAYGGPLDPILSKFKDKDHVYISKIKESANSLLNMLNAGRIDYTLSYATQLKYRSEKLGLSEAFVYLPIAENDRTDLITYYIGCAKTDTCKKFITEIDSKINTEEYFDKISDYYSRWLDPNARQEFKCLKEIFISIKSPK